MSKNAGEVATEISAFVFVAVAMIVFINGFPPLAWHASEYIDAFFNDPPSVSEPSLTVADFHLLTAPEIAKTVFTYDAIKRGK